MTVHMQTIYLLLRDGILGCLLYMSVYSGNQFGVRGDLGSIQGLCSHYLSLPHHLLFEVLCVFVTLGILLLF